MLVSGLKNDKKEDAEGEEHEISKNTWRRVIARLGLSGRSQQEIREMTLTFAMDILNEMNEEIKSNAKIHGCEIKGEKKDEEEFVSFSDAFKAMKGD